MSISGALSNALSGLAISSRAAEIVASNISNAATPGYAPRDLEQAARQSGGRGGVMVVGVARHVDAVLQSDFRAASTATVAAQTHAGYAGQLADLFGEPGQEGALSTLLAEFEGALITAAADPSSMARLHTVGLRANDLSTRLNVVSDRVQTMRVEIDAAIARDIQTLNERTAQIVDLNARIGGATGQEAAALADLRDQALDDIAQIVPIRIMPRDRGQIAVFTQLGVQLVDGPASRLGFDPTPTIQPHMTLASGDLAGLSVNDRPVTGSDGVGGLAGGRLSALFQLRDDTLVQAQAQADGLARELEARLRQPGVDPTLGAGQPGLFTDLGAAFDGVSEVGLAGRIAVNADALADPWKLRDGLQAVAPGAVGNAGILNALVAALDAVDLPAGSALPPVARSLGGMVSDLQSVFASARLEADRRSSFFTAQRDVLHDRITEGGVDTDAELQKLMLVEQTYAANARVIETIGGLIDSLMRI